MLKFFKTRILLANILNTSMPDETCFPHLGLGYLASNLRQSCPNAFEIKIINGQDVIQTMADWHPDVVGITTSSQYFRKALTLAHMVKSIGVPVIMGGVHVSVLPRTVTSDVNIAVVGEGEITFAQLMTNFASDRKFHPRDIKGVAYWMDRDMFQINARREDIELDKLPLPARDLMPIKQSTSMFTSRGCPYRCVYCASARYWDTTRFFSAEYVVNEIETLYQQYKVRDISLLDDLFIADKKRLQSIVVLLDERNLLGKLTYVCNVRSNLVTDDLAKMLSFMGVRMVGMGIESGCRKTLEWLKGRGSITVEDHVNALTLLRKHNIHIHPSFIIGSPYETRDDILETLRFIEQNKVRDFEVYSLNPLPGTPVWDYAVKRGLVKETPGWDWPRLYWNYHLNPDPVILSEALSKEDIDELHAHFTALRCDLHPGPLERVKSYVKVLRGRV